MDRPKKPTAIGVNPSPPQPTITLNNNIVTATLPTGESVTVNLYGATVTSWKLSNGTEQLFLSENASLDGSKPIRGGIPIVFPVFGPPPKTPPHATTPLPQHGFARNSLWEFLGKESKDEEGVKLDFGLSSSMLSEDFRGKWPYAFGLVYSVTLSRESLGTALQVQNKEVRTERSFEFQVLLHTYLGVEDISTIRIKNLQGKEYIDKTQNASVVTEASAAVQITGETDRVYKSLDAGVPIVVSTSTGAGERDIFSIARDGLNDVVVWNPWVEKAKAMGDFSPDDGYKRMVCVEAGSVVGWQVLEPGESWEGGQVIRAVL